MIDGIEHRFHCVNAKYFSFYNGLDMQNDIERQQSNFEVRCWSFRVKEVQKEIKSFLQNMQTNNWFICQRAFIEIWSTREVWRARKMRKSNSGFLRDLNLYNSQSLWFYCMNFYRWNIQNWKYMTADFIMIHPKLKIHECRWWCVFSTLIQSTSSPDINISFVSCVHFQNHSALLNLLACQKMLLCDGKISIKTFELIEGRKIMFDNKIVHCSFSNMKN